MGGGETKLTGPDLAAGIAEGELGDKALLGHAAGEPVLMVRRGTDVFAVGATCTHYSGPLAEGLIVGDTVRCPWHHACFDLRTGAAERAPALNPIPCYTVERKGGLVRVGARRTIPPVPTPGAAPRTIAIIGAGA